MNLTKNVYNFMVELKGTNYFDLIDYATKKCEYFLLVTDHDEKQLSIEGIISLLVQKRDGNRVAWDYFSWRASAYLSLLFGS